MWADQYYNQTNQRIKMRILQHKFQSEKGRMHALLQFLTCKKHSLK